MVSMVDKSIGFISGSPNKPDSMMKKFWGYGVILFGWGLHKIWLLLAQQFPNYWPRGAGRKSIRCIGMFRIFRNYGQSTIPKRNVITSPSIYGRK